MATTKRTYDSGDKAALRLLFGKMCNDEYSEYKNDEKDDRYKLCCEVLDYCAFYWQTWFWCLCAGLIFLAIVASIVGSVFCCCVRRGRGGSEDKGLAGDDSEPSEESVKANNPA